MNQQEVRDKLMARMLKLEIGVTKMAPIVGISEMTMQAFISKSKDVKIPTLGKIMNYLEKVNNS